MSPQPAHPARRSLLGAGLALPLLPALTGCGQPARPTPPPSATTGPTGRLGIPVTRSVAARGELTAVQRSPFPLVFVALSWRGPERGPRIRFDGRPDRTSGWLPVRAGCPCGGDTAPDGVRHALVPAGGARSYQVGHPPGVDLLTAVGVDTVHGPLPAPTAPSTAPPPPRRAAPDASRRPAGPSGGDLDALGVITRADWGADETKAVATRVFAPARAVTVHHTVTANRDPDPAATIRAIFELHAVRNGWGDIGYHFLVDGEGRVYEGRASGDDGPPGHNSANEVVTAFHTGGFNTGNIGVALLGDLDKAPPTPAARRALTRLAAALTDRHTLDPLRPLAYTASSGRVRRLPSAVNGHGLWTPTACPGARLDIPALRRDLARLPAR
ncbi:peptidoglycan recognition protein family protein [Streptomyces lichenis]|uniref:Peptidoglycan recognition protein family protein n=1 Tax=Streptomyces lichenis TaxID=2306967 RepID=A0ABT0IA45_9ACTN|nr:peptidoglycan recognition family protein [Streptomyces lichenis]MCK8678201.1 peptidoglycan recognition protein family protein [Streptomyces lichenis]